MKYLIDGIEYNVIIVRKNNKNTYIRVKEDMSIYVTTNKLIPKIAIKKILDQNINSIKKMLSRQLSQNEKDKSFFYLGSRYDIIELPTIKDVEVSDKKIYVPNEKKFQKWYKDNLKNIFQERLIINFDKFKESNICPTLKIRTMKTRWGVYNRVKHTITLNSHLLEYGYDEIDYVIIHELSHIVHFNHSKEFWKLVEKYCSNYKEIRKRLKK